MTDGLVIAAASFIGQHVCRTLSAAGLSFVRTRRVAIGHDELSVDLTNEAQVDAAIANVQPKWVIQCAGATSSRDPKLLHETHVFGTLNLLTAIARHAPTARVLLMGSAAEYGSLPVEQMPLTEDCLPNPSSYFGASKLAQTVLAQGAAREHGLQIVSLRPFNVIGPGLPNLYFARTLAERLIKMRMNDCPAGSGFDLTNASATRDFVDVRDVAAACLTLVRGSDSCWQAGACRVFNVCTSRETALLELATLMGQLAGGFVPVPAGTHDSRGGINRSCGSYQKLAAATSWEPTINWQTSVTDMWRELTS